MSTPNTDEELQFVDETMTEVRRNWNVILQDQFNPIPIALELLQSSNPAHDLESFERLHGRLDQAMEIIVNRYYTGFNDAVAIFGGTVESIVQSKKTTGDIKEHLEAFRDQIQYKRTDLPEMWTKLENYKKTIAAMDKLKKLEKVGEQVAALRTRKFLVAAATLLRQASIDISTIKLDSSEAVRNIEHQLEIEETCLFDTLVEEFHAHVYLKRETYLPQLYAFVSQKMPSLTGKFDIGIGETLASSIRSTRQQGQQMLVDVEAKPNDYIEAIIVSLAIIDSLPEALLIIEQRLASELFQISDAAIKSTANQFRRGQHIQQLASSFILPVANSSKSAEIEFINFCPFLRTLLMNLFVKFATVLVIYAHVGDVISQISPPPEGVHYSLRPFVAAVNVEVKSIVITVVHGSQNVASVHSNAVLVITEALRGKRKNQPSAPTFHLTCENVEADLPILREIRSPLSEHDQAAAMRIVNMIAIDPLSTSKRELGHRSIVKPNLQYLTVVSRCVNQLASWVDAISSIYRHHLPHQHYLTRHLQGGGSTSKRLAISG